MSLWRKKILHYAQDDRFGKVFIVILNEVKDL